MQNNMENIEIKVGRVYRAKKPKPVGFFERLYDDRVVLYVDPGRVQYDSPSVKVGKKHPFIEREKFIKWASRDVTDELPKGEWGAYP